MRITSEKEITPETQPPAVTFKTPAVVSSSASQIFDSYDIPTYPISPHNKAAVPSKAIYIPPAFIIKQDNYSTNSNNNFLLTPLIDKIPSGTTILVDQESQVASGLAKVKKIRMTFAEDDTNTGFSFGISNSIPNIFRLPKLPIQALALFINIDYIDKKGIKFSNPSSFKSPSPQIDIAISKSFNAAKLTDGCPDISMFYLNELAVARISGDSSHWQISNKPIRDKATDNENECGYTLETGHFSKFAVGGIVSPPIIVSR